jgi:hypothetical protein
MSQEGHSPSASFVWVARSATLSGEFLNARKSVPTKFAKRHFP